MDIDLAVAAAHGARARDPLRRTGADHRAGDPHRVPQAHRPALPESGARAELDRKTGHVAIYRARARRRGTRSSARPSDSPDDFGRIAAFAAKQVINQRLRDIGDDKVLGEFRGREGDIVAGVIQQGPNPRMVHIDLGTVEAILPPEEQVPGEEYAHGTRIRVYVTSVREGPRRARRSPSRRTHPALVRKLFALEVPEIASGRRRDHLARPRGRPPHQDRRAGHRAGHQRQGRLHRRAGARVRAVTERAQRREDRHRRLVATTSPRSSPTRSAPAKVIERVRRSTSRCRPCARSCPTTSSRSRSARRARTPASPPSSRAPASTSSPTRSWSRERHAPGRRLANNSARGAGWTRQNLPGLPAACSPILPPEGRRARRTGRGRIPRHDCRAGARWVHPDAGCVDQPSGAAPSGGRCGWPLDPRNCDTSIRDPEEQAERTHGQLMSGSK